MPGPSCPTCGETAALTGHPAGTDIEITCEACETRFLRGERQCESCGSSGAVEAEQRMTRHPRGNMLAVVGVRSVPLCPTCDSDVLADALAERRPVPEAYVSRFLYGQVEEFRPVRKVPQRPAGPRATRLGAGRVTRPSEPTRPAVGPEEPPRLADPTVRQATEQFLLQADHPVDSVALVILGSFLGPSARVSSLESARTRTAVGGWFEGRWGSRSARAGRETARETVVSLAAYWQCQGWMSSDLAEGLRAEGDQPRS